MKNIIFDICQHFLKRTPLQTNKIYSTVGRYGILYIENEDNLQSLFIIFFDSRYICNT